MGRCMLLAAPALQAEPWHLYQLQHSMMTVTTCCLHDLAHSIVARQRPHRQREPSRETAAHCLVLRQWRAAGPAALLRVDSCHRQCRMTSTQRHQLSTPEHLDTVGASSFPKTLVNAFGALTLQSNLLKWIALGPDYEYPLRQSIHLSTFYAFHCVWTGPNKWYPFKWVIHLSSINWERFDCISWKSGRAYGL